MDVDRAGSEVPISLRNMEELSLSDSRQVEDAFSRFPSTVAGLAAEIDGRLVGMVASSFTAGVSFDPAMAFVSVRNGSSTWDRLRRASPIGVSIFGEGQGDAVYQLASRTHDRFARRDLLRTSSGDVYFSEAAIWLGAQVAQEVPVGDHIMVLLKIEGIGVNESVQPLIYVNRRMQRIASRDEGATA